MQLLHLEPRPSRRLAAAVSVVHTLALVASLLNGLPLPVRLGLAVTVVVSLAHSLRRWVLDPPIIRGRADGEGNWELTLRDDAVITARILGSTLSAPGLILLHFRSAQTRLSWLLLRDSLDAETYRRLQVHLRVTAAGDG